MLERLKDISKKYKTPILFVVIIVLVFIAYSILFLGDNDDQLLVSEVASESEFIVGIELLSILLELKSIDLREDVFANPTFRSLEDFSQEIVPRPVGRRNPFAPLGVDEDVSPSEQIEQ